MKLKTILRVLLFCLLCAIGLALFSGLFKDFTSGWSPHLMLLSTIAFTLGLIPRFVKWEGLQLKDVGIIPNKLTIQKVTIGFLLGLVMTLFQPAFVYLLGHYQIEFTNSLPLSTILNFLVLYILVAIREELAIQELSYF